MIFSDLPSPAEAFIETSRATRFAEAGRRFPLFATMLYFVVENS
jgi:hypothetical protein